jgi:hypothetical protein
VKDIAIGIKTFLRDDKLFKAIDGIRQNLPNAQIIVADDGYSTEPKTKLYSELEKDGHIVIICPFDSGFGYKSNAIASKLDRLFLLIGSDDFDFTPDAARGISQLREWTFRLPHSDVFSGRVNSRPYEFYLDINDGIVTEKPALVRNDLSGAVCDLTVNYSLIRRKVFDNIKWDNDVKIGGGEHGAFFYDVHQAGYRVVYINNVNINEQKAPDTHLYRSYRSRALSKSRPCFEKRGIKKWILGTGEVDYDSNLS